MPLTDQIGIVCQGILSGERKTDYPKNTTEKESINNSVPVLLLLLLKHHLQGLTTNTFN